MSQKQDQFASLFAASLKPKPSGTEKNLNLSLLERQKLQSSSSKTPNSSQWDGIDLLGRSGNNTSLSSNINSTGNLATLKSSNGSFDNKPEFMKHDLSNKTEDLFEGFPSYASSSQQPSMDDLFAVFDKPSPSVPTSRPISNPTNDYDNIPRRSYSTNSSQKIVQRPPHPTPRINQDTVDESIAQLMEMGFSLEQSKSALSQTSNGINVQQAISVLMNAAHGRSRPNSAAAAAAAAAAAKNNNNNTKSDYIQEFSKLVSSTTTKFMNSSKFFSPQGTGSNNGRPAWMKDNEKYMEMSRGEYNEEPVEFDEFMLQKIKLNDNKNAKDDDLRPKNERLDHNNLQEQSQSSYRRREPVPPSRPIKPEFDLLSMGSKEPEIDLFNTPSSITTAKSKSIRPIVSISSTQLTFFKDSREQGNLAFKQGDFSLALQHYETALSSLPNRHLLKIIGFSNCITALLKNGQNKKALTYSESALEIIGQSKGKGEEVEPGKDMFSFWIKITSKKAEALEHLERYQDALKAYTELIENGSTGKTIMEGKRRCQDILKPKPKPKPTEQKIKTNTTQFTNETVQRVKDTHLAESQLESQKFALHDVIDSKLQLWCKFNETNLRHLLSTLHTILPSELQWKPISSQDLVMPKKVKISYMKAVSKCHPDKIKRDASIECKMICESVFVVLNNAWEKFRVENGL